MATAKEKFFEECGYEDGYYGCPLTEHGEQIPCYGLRISVNNEVNTPERITKLIRYAKEARIDETMLFFSVTEKDGCWKAWADFAKANPKVFAAVVETKSSHRPNYKVRMYIVVKKLRAQR